MSPVTALRNLRAKKIYARDVAALALLIISVGTSVSTYLLYSNSRQALRLATQGQLALRAQRKLTEYHFCTAINQTREINNRDRRTIRRGLRESQRDLKQVTDPVLHGLLERSIVQSKKELRIRPKLSLLHCIRVIQHPTGPLPPALRNPLPSSTTNTQT